MKTCRIPFLTLWLTLLATVLGLLLSPRPLLPQIAPNTWFFEIDGDYGDWLEDTKENDGEDYLPALDVNLTDGSRSWGRRQMPCTNWAHTMNAPYTGSQSYRVQCEGSGDQRRTEQMVLSGWYPNSADSQRYFSLAFRLVELPLPNAPPPETRGYIAQLHQGGTGAPPFRVQWEYLCPPDSAACGYYLTMGVRSDKDFVEFGPPLGGSRNRKGVAVSLNVWYRTMFRINILPDLENPPCPGSGDVQAWIMDNPTGAWSEVGHHSGPLGYRSRSGQECSFQWKVGIYANNADTITIDYDNVAYGKRWNNVTKNRLIGYQKSVLRLSFDEGQGTTVNDRSWTWNGGQVGDPVSDYNNDGRIEGDALWNSYGLRGKSLRFDGTNYVKVPVDVTDFDFGNYVTVSAWFRTTCRLPSTACQPTSNKGLVMIDEFSNDWKVLLYASDTLLSFGVRHPDRSTSRVNYTVHAGQYADGQWHHIVGTFNRFTTDNRRIKLYIDGVRMLQREGYDFPILRGENRMTVGKFSVDGYFIGDIDEVNVLNYAMTDEDVESLWLKRGAP